MLLPALPWLLLAEALWCLVGAPYLGAVGLRFLSAAVLCYHAPAHPSLELALAMFILVSSAAFSVLLGVFIHPVADRPDLPALTFPIMVVSALALGAQPARLLVLLLGLWPLWITVAWLRKPGLLEWTPVLLLAGLGFAALPLVVGGCLTKEVMAREACRRRPRTLGQWPCQELRNPPLRLHLLLAVASILLLPPLGGLLVSYGCIGAGTVRRRERATLSTVCRLALAVSWSLQGCPLSASPLFPVMALLALLALPVDFVQRLKQAKDAGVGTPELREAFDVQNHLGLEIVAWSLAVWLSPGLAGMALMLAVASLGILRNPD